MTPNLVATSALINFDYPNRTSTGLPGVKSGAAYGDYASGIWLKALSPTLGSQTWSWDSASDVPGQEVPSLTGKTLSEARAAVAGEFKIVPISDNDALRCPSTAPTDSIAFYGPHKAPAGSTITVCQSLGVLQDIYVAPKVTKKPSTRTRSGASSGPSSGSGSGNGSGSGSGSGAGGGSGASSSPGPGSGTGSGGGPAR